MGVFAIGYSKVPEVTSRAFFFIAPVPDRLLSGTK